MKKPPAPFPRKEWRSLLRSLLRESSYLPDPIARSACHDQVLQRFRRYHEERRTRIRTDPIRLVQLHKNARHHLSILRRANEAFSRPLEKVLRFAYGRTGRRRRELLSKMLAEDAPQDSNSLETLLTNPSQFEDGWKPPTIITTLLTSQNNNPTVGQLSGLPSVKDLKPPIPEKNAWGRSVPLVRRRNIRRRWYKNVLDVLLPPLPESELRVLEGLISGQIPWKPPRLRYTSRTTTSATNNVDTKAGMIRTILTAGPPKEGTFRPYINGRPHKLTRRFMCRLWKRISSLVPRQYWNAAGNARFTWDSAKPVPTIALSAREESSWKLFRGADASLVETKTLASPPEGDRWQELGSDASR
ncbi:uncharacterized protein BJX67DRAFT_105546 [Aspergillus lucknowensis]|uniref:LYR motif-containing protein Cup1-like N-terminal domain-containing protein n=1 Tax=Aspergillus lucknowensis TaxID=176173 RepID=A0ABR4LV05_9EURO